MPVRQFHDPAAFRGTLHVREGGLELVADAQDVAGATPCPSCGVTAMVRHDPNEEGPFETAVVCRACGTGHEFLVRVIPCTTCGQAKTPSGDLYLMGGNPPGFPFVYSCGGCRRQQRLSASQFNLLPLLGPDEYRKDLPAAKPGVLERAIKERALVIQGPKNGLGRLLIGQPSKVVKPQITRIPVADIAKAVPR